MIFQKPDFAEKTSIFRLCSHRPLSVRLSGIFIAPSTATTAGIRYSLATIEQCESKPPDSEMTAPAFANRGVQLASEYGIMRTSPGKILL